MNRLMIAPILAVLALPAAAQELPSLGLPIGCALGSDCFVQQYPDMDGGPGAADPFCTGATYDGHAGTDIRIRYMADIAMDVPVLAAAAGTVLRLRDGIDDRAVRSDADRKLVAGLECGNGLVIDHGDGWETQYCHMKRGSLSVHEGQSVAKGDTLGAVGASGNAAFPHIHISLRHNGRDIDPFSGEPVGSGCNADTAGRALLWDKQTGEALLHTPTQLLDAGFAPGPIDQEKLLDRRPQTLAAGAGAYVGWANLINLREGDRITLVLLAPNGQQARHATKPLDRDKARYALFAGKRGAPPAGDYILSVEVLRDGKPVLSESREMILH